MFVTAQEELPLDSFLKAVQFIPPAGKTIEYFISPEEIDDTPGFEAEQTAQPSDSIVYTRKDPGRKIDQQSTPADYADTSVPKVENSGPKATVLPRSTPISNLKCPFVEILSDDNLGTDLLLKESFGPFYKNTIFHCL